MRGSQAHGDPWGPGTAAVLRGRCVSDRRPDRANKDPFVPGRPLAGPPARTLKLQRQPETRRSLQTRRHFPRPQVLCCLSFCPFFYLAFL